MPSVIRGDDNFDSGVEPEPITDAGAVGTYMFGRADYVQYSALDMGETTAGSSLRPATANGTIAGAAPSGTWRTMGYALTGDNYGPTRTTLFVRIS